MTEDAELLRDTLRQFRGKEVEPHWESLDTPEAGWLETLWKTLRELGVTDFGRPEALDGMPLDVDSRLELLRALGESSPALGAALIGHVTAQALLIEAAAGKPLDAELGAALADGSRFALLASPLDIAPEPHFELGAAGLSGRARVAWPEPAWLVVPARSGERRVLCVLNARAVGAGLSAAPSSHGLCLLGFGELALDGATHAPGRVFEWPSAHAAARQADGLLAALLLGMTDELCQRAAAYALERYQGGKMIHEHDAVRQLVGPIELSRRVLAALARDTLSSDGPADGGAAAFAVALTRQSGLDSIQTFGGYGYMEDYRVERYLRDANTLETLWIHAESRRRAIAVDRFAAMGR